MNALVVGAGVMGRWFARVLREADRPVGLGFCDAASDRAQNAATALDGRVVPTDSETSVDLVCIAVPIPAATDAIATYGPLATVGVVDVTGSMTDPVAAMAEHAPAVERASFHPLFAPDNEPGNVPAVIDAGGEVTETLVSALEARGNTVFETTAAEHDEMMETVQAKTHAAVLAYALAADEVPDRFHTPVSEPLETLARRVTGGDSHVYADIQATFDGADDIADAAARIAGADRDAFETLYAEAMADEGPGGQ